MKLNEISFVRKTNGIIVKNAKVLGINNPLINLEMSNVPKEIQFFVFVDENSIEFDVHMLADEGNFVVEAILPKTCKNILVLAKIDDTYYELVSKRNSMCMRILNKIKGIMAIVFCKVKVLFITLGRGIRFLWNEHHFIVPPALWKKYFDRLITRVSQGGEVLWNPFIKPDYFKWLKENEKSEPVETFDYNPLISILIPVYNVDKNVFVECIESILNQSYQNFEICLCDDCSTKQETKDILKYYETKDSRIKIHYRNENGHISNATNDALNMASGEFVGLVDNDDVLTQNALYENVKALNANKELDFIYSDEDKLDTKGNRCDPNFKPDYSPDSLMSLNYICHFSVLRTSIVREIGGFSVGLEGAQDHDLFLRFVEKTTPERIHHIPKVLYHWRMVEGSTSMTIENKEYAMEKGKMAIENAIQRRGLKGYVEKDVVSTYYRVHYEMEKEPSVSIIVPTRDYADITEACLKSVFEKTEYTNYEVILVDNNSVKEETFDLFERYKNMYSNFRVVKADMEFNYSAINNLAVRDSKADVIVLLNNDTEVISQNWLKVMVSYATLKHVGAVGPKLLYPDTTVQHAGVIIGLGGVANHLYIGYDRNELGMYGRLRVPYNYTAVTAACLAVERSKFDEVGGLEEDLMVAFNDMDLNMKLAAKGYYNVCVPHVELFHYESKSRGLDTTSEKYRRFLFESDYIYKKWDNYIKNDPMYNPNFSKKGLYMLDKKIKG